MFIPITSKCNMSRGHCPFSCSPKKGKHMTKEVFKAALRLPEDRGDKRGYANDPRYKNLNKATPGVAYRISRGML
jgi:hypothetical protein